MSLRTIIVEDEPLSRIFLKNLLAEFCPSVKVTGTASTENEAIELIEAQQPDIVFMDIELQQGTGFSVLQRTRHCNYHIIFTTALDYEGIRAIRYSGADYIQKPIDIQSLQHLINCMQGKMQNENGKTAVKYLLETLDNGHVPVHLLVNTLAGVQYIKIADIIYIEAYEYGCMIFTESGNLRIPSTGIKDFEKLLESKTFYRLHSSYIVNLMHIRSASAGVKDCVHLSDNSSIPVSPKKTELLQSLLSGTGNHAAIQTKRY